MSAEEIAMRIEHFRKRKELDDLPEVISSKFHVKVPETTNNEPRSKKRDRSRKKMKTIEAESIDHNFDSNFFDFLHPHQFAYYPTTTMLSAPTTSLIPHFADTITNPTYFFDSVSTSPVILPITSPTSSFTTTLTSPTLTSPSLTLPSPPTSITSTISPPNPLVHQGTSQAAKFAIYALLGRN